MDLATIMRGAGVTARPHQHRQHVEQPQPQLQQQQGQQPVAAPSVQQQLAAQAAAPAGPASMETVRVRLPDSSGNKPRKGRSSSSMPRIIGVVKDDKALPGSRGTDGMPAPRPATLLPRTTKVAPAAAAEGAAVSSSSSEAPQYTPLADAGAAVAMAAATAGSGGAAATAAADADGGSSLAQAAASSNGAGSRSSSRAGSRRGSPDGQQQQQKAQQAAAVDKDLAWDEWSQILAPWRVSATAAARVHCYFKQCARVCTQGGMLHQMGGLIMSGAIVTLLCFLLCCVCRTSCRLCCWGRSTCRALSAATGRCCLLATTKRWGCTM